MPSSYFDPTYSSPLTGIDYELDPKAFPTWKPDPDNTFNWTAQKEKEPTFGDRFKDALAEGVGSYTKRFAGAGAKRDGDINYIKSEGATTADLGGGNTLYVPDNTAAQLRMAQAGQQGSSGGGIGRMAGSILGQAGGAALGSTLTATGGALAGSTLGTAVGSALGPLGAVAGAALGGLLPF